MIAGGRFVAITLSCAALSACSQDPLIQACRQAAEENIAAPSTLRNFKGSISQQELERFHFRQVSKEGCAELGWPSDACQAIEQSNAIILMSSEERERHEDRAWQIVSALPLERRQSRRVLISFDAANEFNTPIRHEAECVFGPAATDKRGEPVWIAWNGYRGFE